MRTLLLAAIVAAAGCGGHSSSMGPPGFDPPAPNADELQIMSPLITGITPGTDETLCSYVDVPIPMEIDVIGSRGQQSLGGHHAMVYIAHATHAAETHVCNENDMLSVRFVAGIGAEGATSLSVLPDGVSFRVPAGAQLMMQTHWINATNQTLEGQAAINLHVVPPSSDRVPADLFSVVNTQFSIPAGQSGTASTTCPVGQSLSMFYLGGHEHAAGTHFKAEQTTAAGATSTLYEHDWQPEYEFNPPVNSYPKASPLVVNGGDQIKVTCTWDNTSGVKPLTFPTDMCVAFGFYFPGHGEIDCIDGYWPTK